MVKLSDKIKEDVVYYVEQHATLLTDLETGNGEYIKSFNTLISALNKEKLTYKNLRIKYILADVLNKNQKIKHLKYGDGTFKLLVLGNFDNSYSIVEAISKSKAFHHFTDSTLLLPKILCLNTNVKLSTSYKTIIKHSVVLLNVWKTNILWFSY